MFETLLCFLCFINYLMQIALFFFFSEAVTQRCFVNKVVLRNLAKFTGKHMCQGLFFGKVTGLWPATLLKKRLWHRCFPVNFVKFLQTPFLTEHLWWLHFLTEHLWWLHRFTLHYLPPPLLYSEVLFSF